MGYDLVRERMSLEVGFESLKTRATLSSFSLLYLLVYPQLLAPTFAQPSWSLSNPLEL